MGIPATATTASTLPADFRVDAPATIRTVGTFSGAGTTTTRVGGANLSTSAANGIYNFGSGTTTLGGIDRAVGFLSSGTATASGNLYAQFVNNTGGALSGLKISYDVEKYRKGSNSAGFRIQLFYSTDGITWTSAGSNFLNSFTADADNTGFATVPGATASVSNQTLSASIPNGSNFYLAWNYSVASGSTTTNAQALAIDNISVLGLGGNTSTNPSGVGAANPGTVQAGNSTLLTVTVTPGTNPASTGLAVAANLTSIGGSASQQFFDDGTHGDVTASDNTFSFLATVSAATSAAGKTIPATISDAQSRTGSASISLTVTPASTPPTGTGSANPSSLQAGNTTLLKVSVTPGTNPTSTGLGVVGDLTSIGGSASQQFFDDATHGDAVAGDNIFSFQAAVAGGTSAGAKSLPVTISDAQSRSSTSAISLTVQPPPPPTTVKISQVYGGGGNSGSTYTNDFIELYNSGSTPVTLDGWSVQATSATATSWAANGPPTLLSGTIQPGHYYLIQEAQGGGGTTPLPSPDATGLITMSATNAKVALVASTVTLSGTCPVGSAVVDLVGYGTANCFEGAATPGLSNTTAAVRRGNGCTDTGNNSSDFVVIGPIPRNSASPVNSCGGDATQPSGLGLASPSTLEPSGSTLLSVIVTPATTPPSTGLAVVGDLTAIGGSATQTFYDDGTNGDQVAGDNIFSVQATLPLNTPFGVKNILATITDAQARTATAPITLTAQSPTCGVERWSVKVGTDPDVTQVNLNNPVHTTIQALGALTPPADPPGPPDNSRVQPTESTVYVIDATMTFYKKEADVDYHIVLQDDTGHTMIAEIPSPACILSPTTPRALVSSPLGSGIANARAKFDARFTATTSFQTANVPVRVKGVAFFDFIHGQNGVARNGIELHPVLDIDFTANTMTTLMSSANPSQYAQQVAITATVSNGGAAATPTGNVTFFDGGNPIDVVALDQNGQATFTSSTLSAGPHSITASYEGDDASAPSTSAALSQVVNKADQAIAFGPLPDKTYGDAPFTLSATGGDSGNPVTFSASGNCTSGGANGSTITITGAGSCTVTASQAGDANYNPASDVPRTFTINQAAASIKVNGYSGVYDGHAHGATGSATGVNDENLSSLLNLGASFTNVPGGIAHWTFAGDNNYSPASGDATIALTQADANITVSGYTGVYDGSGHGATGSATGVGGEDLSSLLNLGESFTKVPGGTAHWTFAGDVNYKPTSGTASIVINKATPVLSWNNPADITYGTALGNDQLNATASVPGTFAYAPVAGTILSAGNGQTLSASFTPTDATNYNGGSVTASINVLKATPTVNVAGGTFTYDGAAHPATGSVVGVGSPGEDLGAPDFTYNGGAAAPVNAGTYNVVASFAGNSNYNSASNTATIMINKATPALTWNSPADITYGTPLGSAQLNVSANVPGTFTYTPAQGTVLSAGPAQPLLASFMPADVTNYSATTKIVTINVLKATPAFSNLSSPSIGCGTATVNLSGRITLGPLAPTGSVAITLNGVTQNAAIRPDGSFSSAFATGALTPAGSPFAVTFSYGGDGNFNPAGGAGTLTVADGVPPTITLKGNVISLWPANKRAYTISVTDLVASASDSCDAGVNLNSVVISQVSSDEGTASGGDVVIAADCRSVQLRADRNGGGDGRVYTITFRVRDAYGNTTTSAANVIVPHDQGSGNNAVDSGPAYTVTSGCP